MRASLSCNALFTTATAALRGFGNGAFSNRNIDRGLIECASSSDGKTKSSKAYSLAKQEPVKVRSTIGIATQKIESSTVVC